MKTNRKPSGPDISHRIWVRIISCALILLGGFVGMNVLAGLKKPPAEVSVTEQALRVEAVTVKQESTQIVMTAFGEASALNKVVISPEVSGRIVTIHPRLEVGEMLTAGDVLFGIDSLNYQAARDEARASVQQINSTISILQKQIHIDTDRLDTLKRNEQLARAEFERLSQLLEKKNVGTRSGVEKTEQAFNTAKDMTDQVKRALALYPIQIKEAQSAQASAQARLALAQANLNRCRITAPFNGRVTAVSLENGQFVSPGQQVLTLADDAVLEIQVSLDSRDARKWLQFDGQKTSSQNAWFKGLKQVPSRIEWTEDKAGHAWEGILHRVVKFDQKTRTLTVAVRVDARHMVSKTNGRLPLVEGMFCSVRIPGKTLENVIRLPRQAVSFQNTAHIMVNNRLKTVPVKVARTDGEFVYISSGLKSGDIVVTTRLIDPLENSLLEIIAAKNGGTPS